MTLKWHLYLSCKLLSVTGKPNSHRAPPSSKSDIISVAEKYRKCYRRTLGGISSIFLSCVMSTFCSTDNVPPSGDDISLWYWTFPKALIIALGCWQYHSIVVNSTESADDNSTMYSLYPWVLLKPSVVRTRSRLLRRDLKQQDFAAKRMRCPQYLISFSPSNFHAWVIDLFFGLIIFSVHQVSLFKVPD